MNVKVNALMGKINTAIKASASCILISLPIELTADTISVRSPIDCGDWKQSRSAQTSSAHEAYVIGTVNGMAIGRLIDLWNYREVRVSTTQVFYWLDNYCTTNPLKSVITGLDEFANERTQGAWRARVKN